MRKFVLFSVALGLSFPSESYSFTKKEGSLKSVNSTSVLLSSSAKSAVQNTVQGTVTDGKGPVSEVSVSVIGGNASTKTDAQGHFKITAAVGSKLRFSSVGYITREVPVTSNSLNVTLVDDNQTLNEVVVVGYGTQKKSNLTGAVASVNIKETMQGRPIADAGRAMQGTTPGLSIVIPSGEVGSDPTIKIRGQIGSITGSNNPLILLDNVEIPSINIVNPDDIESISVLKDAAASSIYGAKAAYGVILITTKQGAKTDQVSVNYSNNFSFQNPFKKYEMGTVDALRYSLDAALRVGSNFTGAFYKINEESYQKSVEWQDKYGSSVGKDDPTLYGRDWYYDPATGYKYGVRTYDPYDYMVREWAPTQQHNLSLSGKSGKTSYNVGLGLLDQSGMLKTNTDKFSRYNASVRVSHEINKYITARAGAIYSRTNKQYPYATNSTTADPWLYMYRWSSLYPFGNDGDGDPIRSPAYETGAANVASQLKNYMNFNGGATVNFTKNWKLDFDYTLTNQEMIWNKPGTRFTAGNSWGNPVAKKDANGNQMYVDANGSYVDASAAGAMAAYDLDYFQYTAAGSNPDHYRKEDENFLRHTINAFSTYNLSLDGGHEFKFMAGLNRVAEQTENSWTQITNLLDIKNPQLTFGSGTVTGSGYKKWESQIGFFGRVNYAYKDKYLFEANLRRDGSSKFPTSLRWKWYPSFSAGWVVSQESFMDWSREFVNQFKIRGSWGSIGDQAVPNNLYTSYMTNAQSNWINSSGNKDWYVGSPAAVLSQVGWQDIQTLDFGLDARFLKNKLGLVFDWYQRDTKNMLVPMEGVAATFGAEAPKGNFGALRTRGWELAVDFNHRFENGLGINLRANVSDAKSVITEYGTTTLVDGYYNGKTFGEIWGYETDRLYQKSDFVYENGKLVTTTVNGKTMNKLSDPNGAYQSWVQNSSTFLYGPGDVKFKDLNGDGAIDNGKGTISDHGDLSVIGNSTPRYEYGFRLGADFKGFDLSAFFQGVGSRQVWGKGFLAQAGFNASDGAMPAVMSSDYWTENNTGAFYPAAYSNGGTDNINNMQVQSRYLLDMSYLRIKNLTLGYTLPKGTLSRIGVSNLRIYTALENFFTWDKLNGLPIDPEAVVGVNMFVDQSLNNYNSGRIGVGTPTFKSASFGVQLTF